MLKLALPFIAGAVMCFLSYWVSESSPDIRGPGFGAMWFFFAMMFTGFGGCALLVLGAINLSLHLYPYKD